MNERTVLAIFTLAVASPLFAQDTVRPIQPLMPADSSLVVHMKGTVGTMKVHAGDPYGALMKAAGMKTLWREFSKELQPFLKEWSEALPEDAPVTPQQVLDLPEFLANFDGSITFGAWMSPTINVEVFDADDVCGILQIDPGSADLKTTRAALVKAFDEHAEDIKKLELDGISTAVAAVPNSPGVEVTRPFMYKGQLCVCIGGDVEMFLTSALADAHENTKLATAFRNDSLYAHFDFHNMRQLMRRLQLAENRDQGPTAWMLAMDVVLGLSSMDRMWLRVASKDSFSITDLTCRWKDDPKGIFAALIPQAGQSSKLQRYVPYQLETSSLVCVNFAGAFRNVMKSLEFIGGLEGASMPIPSLDELQNSFREKMGIQLFEDLLDHVGTDYMLIEHSRIPDEDEDEVEVDERFARMQALSEDSCHVLSLRDGAAFAKSFDRVIRKLALHTGRKRNEYKGQRIYTLKNPLFGGLVFHYAVHPECFLVGIGKGGLTCLHAVLDEIKDQASGKERRIPKGLQDRLDHVPDGYYAMSHTNIRELVAFVTRTFELTEEYGPEGWEWGVPDPVTNKNVRRLLGKSIRAMVQVAMMMNTQGADYSLKVLRYRDRTLTYSDIW